MKITHSLTVALKMTASLNNGMGGVQHHDVTISADLAPIESGAELAHDVESVRDKLREWLATYLIDRDWSTALDFPPTPLNLAIYLWRVLSARTPDLVSVTVCFDGELAATVQEDDVT